MEDARLKPLDVTGDEVIEGERESVDELISRLATQVDGIGRATAGAVAVDFEGKLQDFLHANSERLSKIRNSKDRNVLSEHQIESLIKKIQFLPKNRSIEETWVYYLGRQFLAAQVRMVAGLNLDNFDMNPLLAKALNLDAPRKVIAFNVYQTVTRSVVTSWGDTVEEIARFVGCRKNDFTIEGKTGTNFDLIKTIAGIDYYIQVKSGPNTMNVGMVTSLNEAIEKIEAVRPNARGMLGMTYGTRQRISGQITGNLKDADARMKIGREFWDFISEKDDFHTVLFELLDASSSGVLDSSFIDLIEAKINSLEAEWESQNGDAPLEKMLENYL